MDGFNLEAYLEWRAACQRYAPHLDPAMYGGDCQATDSHGNVWVFAFQPTEERGEGQVADRPSEGATEHGREDDDMVHRTVSHPTVNVQVGGVQAEIDEEIAPLIRELWRGGIDTFNSCQENRPGIIWIQFATAADAQMFLNAVAEYDDEPDGLYARITGRWDGFADFPSPWEYDTHPEDLALVEEYLDDDHDDEAGEWHEGDPDFLFPISVRFPTSDYPVVLARMVVFNDSREQKGHARDAAGASGENVGREADSTPSLADATGSALVQAG